MFGRLLRRSSSGRFLTITLGIILLLLFLGTLIYYRNWQAAQKGQIAATQERTLVLARASALAIGDFLNTRKTELLVLAESPNMVSLSDQAAARRQLQTLIDGLNQEPVADIVRVDKDGKLVLIANKERNVTGEGVDLSDREYFRWAKNPESKGKFFVGETITPRGGAHRQEQVFNIATPIYSGKQFNGVILFGLLTSQFAEKYFVPLRIHEKTQAFLINNEGVLIEGEPVKELLGKNLVDYAKEKKWLGWESYVEMITKAPQQEGVGEVFFTAPGEEKATRELVAFAPVKFNEAKLGVLIANPWEITQSILGDFSQNQTLGITLLFFSLLTVGILWSLSLHLTWRDALLQGINDGYRRKRD